MAMKIWETDPDNKPTPRKQVVSDDYVGRFHSGRLVSEPGKRPYPESLGEWRVTTDDLSVGQAVSQLYGGAPTEMEETASRYFIEVLTDRDSIPVVIDGARGIEADMKQWVNGQLVHHCDGVNFLDAERRGEPCGCPKLFAERKEAARSYRGPSPSIRVSFRLADDYDLGRFYFQSTSWSLAAVLHEIEDAVDRVGKGGEVLANLKIELVEYTPKRGPRKGRLVSYYRPAIEVVKGWNDAIAEDV